jgi:hypothetical protein
MVRRLEQPPGSHSEPQEAEPQKEIGTIEAPAEGSAGAKPEQELSSGQDLWRKLNDFDGLSRKEQLEIFEKVAQKNQDIIKACYFHAGYDFFLTNQEAARSGSHAVQMQEMLQYSYNQAYFRAAESEDKKSAGREAVRNDLGTAQDEIMSEYKIHLQPDRRHIGEVTRRLVAMMNDENNADLRQIVGAFKIKTRPDREDEEAFPEIVIYPRTGAKTDQNGVSEGRRNMERTLAAVVEVMHGLESTGQKDRTPRYNAKVNDLVYVAQSGGDFKNFLKRIGLLDEVFDPSTGYGFRRGEKPPTTMEQPEASRSNVSEKDVQRLKKIFAKILRSEAAGVHNLPLIEHAIKEIGLCLESLRSEMTNQVAVDRSGQSSREDLVATLQQMFDTLKRHDVYGRGRADSPDNR